MISALERGLALLEILAKNENPVSFTDINRALGTINRASLSRLLRQLMQSGYIHKDDMGYYSCGDRLAIFSHLREKDQAEKLISTYGPVMKKITRTYDVSTVLLERVKNVLVNIRKEVTPFSMNMQEVNTLNDDPTEPWLFTVACLDSKLKIDYADYPEMMTMMDEVRMKGYFLEDQTKRPKVRRISFPLYDENKNIIGILGVAGNISQMNDEVVKSVTQTILNIVA